MRIISIDSQLFMADKETLALTPVSGVEAISFRNLTQSRAVGIACEASDHGRYNRMEKKGDRFTVKVKDAAHMLESVSWLASAKVKQDGSTLILEYHK